MWAHYQRTHNCILDLFFQLSVGQGCRKHGGIHINLYFLKFSEEKPSVLTLHRLEMEFMHENYMC